MRVNSLNYAWHGNGFSITVEESAGSVVFETLVPGSAWSPSDMPSTPSTRLGREGRGCSGVLPLRHNGCSPVMPRSSLHCQMTRCTRRSRTRVLVFLTKNLASSTGQPALFKRGLVS